jgi:hypothetical protein
VESPKCGVCVSTFTSRGIFIGPWGSSTDLAEVVNHDVVAGRPSHVVGWPMSLASTDFLHHHSLSLHEWTRVLEVLVRTDSKVGRPDTP